MRPPLLAALLALLGLLADAPAQTPEDITKLIERLVALDSIDLTKELKFRPGLEPPLYALDADESGMTALKDPYQAHGQGKPGAAGWYRVSLVAPEKLAKFPLPKGGFNLGVETNCRGSWEVYTFVNGKPAGAGGGVLKLSNLHPTVWVSGAPMPTKPGDKITIAILAMASPLGQGSPEGYGLRHLRLRFALGHTAARQPFFGGVSAPGMGTGLLGAREKLATAKGDDLKALQEKLKDPLSRLDTLFKAAETEQLNELTKAMLAASKEINEALKK